MLFLASCQIVTLMKRFVMRMQKQRARCKQRQGKETVQRLPTV
jgi:hypothetical protein